MSLKVNSLVDVFVPLYSLQKKLRGLGFDQTPNFEVAQAL